jgi:hypothetical protein
MQLLQGCCKCVGAQHRQARSRMRCRPAHCPTSPSPPPPGQHAGAHRHRVQTGHAGDSAGQRQPGLSPRVSTFLSCVGRPLAHRFLRSPRHAPAHAASPQVDDLRLARAWPGLRDFAASFNLGALDDQHHKHVPYGAPRARPCAAADCLVLDCLPGLSPRTVVCLASLPSTRLHSPPCPAQLCCCCRRSTAGARSTAARRPRARPSARRSRSSWRGCGGRGPRACRWT